MNECKFCKREVRFPVLVHSACWENEAEAVASVFCDKYCRWPDACGDQDKLLDEHCSDCALIRLINLGQLEREGEAADGQIGGA